jgi:chromosome segregation ATPase
MKKDLYIFARYISAAALVPVVLFLGGCSLDKGAAEKKVLSYDPSFMSVLKKRDLHNAELNGLKAAFIKVSDAIDAQIEALRDKKSRARREYDASAEKIRLEFQPEVRKVEKELNDAQRRYELKNSELRDIERDANEVNYLMKKKDKLILTDEETKTWNDRLSDLTGKKGSISSEMGKLREEINILKMKLKVMRLK